jgi:3-dehydroquinate synthase
MKKNYFQHSNFKPLLMNLTTDLRLQGIYIDASLQSLSDFLHQRQAQYSKFYILVDEHTHELCIPLLLSRVRVLQSSEIIEMGAGEEYKSLQTATQIWETLIENFADRKTLILNLGGGVVTDLGGLVASLFKRGIDFVHIPTTLLGMIDAAIGGKTAVNVGGAKNMIGTFNPPQGVFISVDFLSTLNRRDLYSGFGELIKYGLIASKDLWQSIEKHELNENMELEWMIEECALIKSSIVSEDFHEKGKRKWLNFGHTAGHALEAFAMHGHIRTLMHGEAVALGMIIELQLSVQLLHFDPQCQQRIQHFILDNFDLYPIENKDFAKLIQWMKMDKKNQDSQVNFVLLSEVGVAHYDQKVEDQQILHALQYYASL